MDAILYVRRSSSLSILFALRQDELTVRLGGGYDPFNPLCIETSAEEIKAVELAITFNPLCIETKLI